MKNYTNSLSYAQILELKLTKSTYLNISYSYSNGIESHFLVNGDTDEKICSFPTQAMLRKSIKEIESFGLGLGVKKTRRNHFNKKRS
jgi:hypothetical protein